MPEPSGTSEGAPWGSGGMACAPKDGRFQAALECIAEAHSQEVWNLHEENQHLRSQILELRDHLRQFQARAICAKIDEPKMQSLAQSVAEDVAGWVEGGGVDWKESSPQDGAWQEKAPEQELEAQGEDRSPGSGHKKKSIIRDGKQPRSSKASEEEDMGKVASVSFSSKDPDVQALPTPAVEPTDNDSLLSELNTLVLASQNKETDKETKRGKSEQSVKSLSTGGSMKEKKSRKSISEILFSPQGSEARMIAQRTLEAVDKRHSPFKKALEYRNKLTLSMQNLNVSSDASQSLRAMVSRKNCVQKLVRNTAFDLVCACMILINSVLIGASTQYLSIYTEESLELLVMGYFCSIFFLLELLLRIFADGKNFFLAPETRVWNAFDAGLVVFSIVEFLMAVNGQSGGVGGSIKTIKMLRILRLFRVFRFFKDLSLLALMVIDSMKSLMNALAMLLIITYVFAICFTVQASNWLHVSSNRGIEGANKVDEHFGNLWKTLYALMQAMLSGISWGELSNALLLVDGFSFALFVFYVFFTMLAVLNIITGVFVDNAVETARTQRDYLVQKEMELKEMYVREMQKLFSQMDEDGSGTVSCDEVKEYFQDPNVKSYFTALGLDPEDSERLFSLLDDDGSGDVGVNEFIDGCLRLKGQARSIDVYALQLQSDRMENRLKEVIEQLPRSFRASQIQALQEQQQLMILENKI